MSELLRVRPDITLAVDKDGVIMSAASAEALAAESLSPWGGLRWSDTVSPEFVGEIEQTIDEARSKKDHSRFTVSQRFPSGRELPIEYTTVSLGPGAGFIAVGKSLQAVSELQSRLSHVQKEREQDYWKLREIETRYRALMDASSEAVALVRVTNLRVVEANVVATRALGLVPGGEFYPDMFERDRRAMLAMLESVRMKGRAPSIALHLSGDDLWSLRASMISSEGGAFYLLQMSRLRGSESPVRDAAALDAADAFAVEVFVQRMPDAFIVVDRQGVARRANYTFLDFVQTGVENAVVGQNARRWLSRPGADIATILELVRRHGSVRAFRTTLEGELGAATEVEISAVADQIGNPQFFGLFLRDVTLRAVEREREPQAIGPPDSTDDGPLEDSVRSSIEAIERRRILDALAQTGGNRTLAAKTLRLSRQSLHAKLKKYRLGRF